MILVVASKVKELIKKDGLNTSAEAIKGLSDHVESVIARAIVLAKKDSRKTVMIRDIQVAADEK